MLLALLAPLFRVTGVIATILAIPTSILLLYGLYSLDSGSVWIDALSVIWAFLNFAALPFILAGFIMRYDFDLSSHLATALFVVIFLIFILVSFSIIPGTISSVTLLALPPTLYLIGQFAHNRSSTPSPDEPNQNQQQK